MAAFAFPLLNHLTMKVQTLDEVAAQHPELTSEVEETKKMHAREAAPEMDTTPINANRDAVEFVLSFGTPDEVQTEKVTINGREFDIKIHTGKESLLIGAQKWRDKKGQIIQDSAEAVDNHIIVTIWQSVVNVIVEEDGSVSALPLFTRDQVETMYKSLPKARAAVDKLWDESVRVNPNLALKNA